MPFLSNDFDISAFSLSEIIAKSFQSSVLGCLIYIASAFLYSSNSSSSIKKSYVCCFTWGSKLKTLFVVFLEIWSFAFNLLSIKRSGVGSIISIIFLFFWSAASFDASSWSLFNSKDALRNSAFILSLSVFISFFVKSGGGLSGGGGVVA